MSLAFLTSKGQVTIPKDIRQYLQIEPGDKLEFVVEERGKVIIEPKTLDVTEIYGIVKSKKSVTLAQMNEAIKKKATRKA